MADPVETAEPQTAIVAVEKTEVLALSREPEVILGEAHRAAAALKKVIDSKKRKVIFGGEVYLEFEDWLTVGRFYGVTARIRQTKYVEFGDTKGWEAGAEALLVSTNQVISYAEAMCLNDEANWNTRSIFRWEKDEATGKAIRRKIGEEVVPLFQLRSMAQTRACAKALRNCMAWVVVLAGYKPTPAEEMSRISEDERTEGTKEASQAVAEKKIAAQQILVTERDAMLESKSASRERIQDSSEPRVLMRGKLSTVSKVKTSSTGSEYVTVRLDDHDLYVFDHKLLPVCGENAEREVTAYVTKRTTGKKSWLRLDELRSWTKDPEVVIKDSDIPF